MRANGVPNLPAPNGSGVTELNSSDGINPNSPQFSTAEQQCSKYEANNASPAQQTQLAAGVLNFSRCMRAHGLTNFPDPQNSSSGGSLNLSGTHINPNSPAFEHAATACEQDLAKNGRTQ